MIGLPEFGDKVRIWPFPGRKVQDGPRPIDKFGGGRVLEPSEDGREVEWSPFVLEQYRAGDILLHAPPSASPAAAPKPKELFNPAAAAAKHIKDTQPAADDESSTDKG